jgi:hypothetical protein
MKKSTMKLKLSRNTVRVLEAKQLGSAVGGAIKTSGQSACPDNCVSDTESGRTGCGPLFTDGCP